MNIGVLSFLNLLQGNKQCMTLPIGDIAPKRVFTFISAMIANALNGDEYSRY